MQISKYFKLSEFTDSQTASRNNIDNSPTPEVLKRLLHTAKMLDVVRGILGHPINISSGYRSPKVNRLVKGSVNSQHVLGEAADFTCPGFGTPREIVLKLREELKSYDQLILEFDRWVHISFTQGINRKQVLVIGTSPL